MCTFLNVSYTPIKMAVHIIDVIIKRKNRLKNSGFGTIYSSSYLDFSVSYITYLKPA